MSKPIKLYRYYLPSVNHEGWAEILVSSTGMFAAVSDYGNYSFAWRNTGHDDFRTFLIQISRDPDYVAGKLNSGKTVLDSKATIEVIRFHLRQMTIAKNRQKEWLRNEWEAFNDCLDSLKSGHIDEWLSRTQIDDAYEFACHDYPASVKCFCEKTMPRLAELLKAELKKE